jgi:tetratricopeptide (TPR) repeat protein
MKRALVTSSLFLFLMALAGCRSGGGDLSQAETQRRFGVRMAKMDLWREAMFRFRRATEIEPANAMARNNLAVAYEATGDYEAALREYREALRLDRSNEYIQKNYSRFVEFSQRSKKREAAAPATAAGAPSSPPLATPPPVVGGDVAVQSAPAPTPTAAQPAVTPPPQQPQPAEVPPPATTTNPPEER